MHQKILKTKQNRLFPAYVVKGWANYHFDNVWGTWSLRRRTIIDDLSDCGQTYFDSSLESLDKSWANLMGKLRKLKIGKGPFHESAIFAELFQGLTKYRRDIWVDIFNSRWGGATFEGGEKLDLVVTNQKNIGTNLTKTALYQFRGYYIFARKEWLKQLNSPINQNFNEQFFEEAKDILLKNEIYNINYAKNNVFKEHKHQDQDKIRKLLPMICGIILKGNFVPQEKTDFENIFKILSKNIQENGELIDFERTKYQVDYDRQFEEFLRGDKKVFLGGAVHSALLRRWWIELSEPKDSPIILLIGPKELDYLEQSWADENYNCLYFSNTLSQDPEAKQLNQGIQALHLELASALQLYAKKLSRELKPSSEDEDKIQNISNYLLQLLMKEVRKHGEKGEKKWGFLTHHADLAYILSEDDKFCG